MTVMYLVPQLGSTRERKPVVNYEPSMTGKKYAFAAAELITTKLGLSYCNDGYKHNAAVACCISRGEPMQKRLV